MERFLVFLGVRRTSEESFNARSGAVNSDQIFCQVLVCIQLVYGVNIRTSSFIGPAWQGSAMQDSAGPCRTVQDHTFHDLLILDGRYRELWTDKTSPACELTTTLYLPGNCGIYMGGGWWLFILRSFQLHKVIGMNIGFLSFVKFVGSTKISSQCHWTKHSFHSIHTSPICCWQSKPKTEV